MKRQKKTIHYTAIDADGTEFSDTFKSVTANKRRFAPALAGYLKEAGAKFPLQSLKYKVIHFSRPKNNL